LLPAALIIFLAVLLYTLRAPTKVHRSADGETADSQRRAEGVSFAELHRDRATLEFVADLVREGEGGKFHLENITRFVINRLGRDPLEVSSELGDYEGKAGARILRFDKQVVIRDPVDDLELILPTLIVDEAAGEARSSGEVTLKGPALEGCATSLVYGLNGQPTILHDPDLENPQGGRMTAEKAFMLDGLDDVEFVGLVRAARGEEYLRTEKLKLVRGSEGKIAEARALGGFEASYMLSAGVLAEVCSASMESHWDSSGELDRLVLDGDALVKRGVESLSAAVINAGRKTGFEPGWSVEARGAVFARGRFAAGPAWMRSEELHAEFDSRMELLSAVATGNVSFEGQQMRAEAGRVEYRSRAAAAGEIQLFAAQRRKARLARGRTRVAAEKIVTDLRGEGLVAENRVEATLLPASVGSAAGGISGMFATDEAVHFVAAGLEARESGNRLTFQGAVRGWQGERNLSAEDVLLDQAKNSLSANGEVNTRIPRDRERAALTEDDYVQIGADRLDYSESARKAEYRGGVTVRLAEGWLEAERMEVYLAAEGRGISEVRAFDSVRVEFHDSPEDAAPTVITGKADRLIYDPSNQSVRLFGDDEPAAVRRMGEAEGTTTGRVLRYHLDSGALEVDSSEQGPARISTSGD
jgi:lipopolysaccharide transport protein LptA